MTALTIHKKERRKKEVTDEYTVTLNRREFTLQYHHYDDDSCTPIGFYLL